MKTKTLTNSDDIFWVNEDYYWIDAGYGNDIVFGGSKNDMIFGNFGNDALVGNNGNDILDGGAGNDYLSGGVGNDTLYGKDGNDLVYGGDGNDYLDGGGLNDSLYGGNGDDVIYGGDYANYPYNEILNGENGNDVLIACKKGGALMTGGNGNDKFVISNMEAGFVNIINDFQKGQDKIIVNDYFTNKAIEVNSSNLISSYGEYGKSTFYYDVVKHTLYSEGNKIAQFSNNVTTLSASDFAIA